ncbi:hypothetical protein JK358_04280 [Nocardia sp. 2]|uniref:PemK-like, MazF-like toxin of type II toxin-antitoxin system n=1 Tax=Nocardia acididurans TaxID=2802282 RepID=A0ABS1LYV6_9NOCA|nr:hypothetical protein [Nocardia acididurans]MBL1073602.1 hypothetical protein [Nocardia acididurans]
MKQGEFWRYAQQRPARDDDERTPYRIILTATPNLASGKKWVRVARIENRDPGLLTSVALGDSDPIPGWVRTDQIDTVYVPWLTDDQGQQSPIGECSLDTWREIRTRLRAEFGLFGDD